MKTNKYNDFDELYEVNKEIQYGSYFKNFYTNEVLFSQQARHEWIPPEFDKRRKDEQIFKFAGHQSI